LLNVYLDTNIPLKPFDWLPPDEPDDSWHEARIHKAKQLIDIIGQNLMEWSTSDFFFDEFYNHTFGDYFKIRKIQDSNSAFVLLRHIYKLALQARHRVIDTEPLRNNAQNLTDSSSECQDHKLTFDDSCHIIASFELKVDRLLTFDHRTILNRHQAFINNRGRHINPNFSCEDPADTDFPSDLDITFSWT
jgi:hypothetical protein